MGKPKERIKLSEAKILIYLEVAEDRFKYARFISSKLKIEYNFLLGRLREMKDKGWLRSIRREQRKYYELNKAAPLEKAKEVYSNNNKR